MGQIKNIKLHIVTDIKGKSVSSTITMATERTFIMIKPDGVARNLVAKIIERFEQRGYKLVAMKFMQAGTDLLNQHYSDLKAKPGSIRGDFSIDMGRNIIHGSDSVESAQKEIALWFNVEELVDWKHPLHGATYE